MEAKMRINPLRELGAGVLLAALGFVALTQGRNIDLSYMDTSVNACDNFYQFANGGWLRKTEIPAAFPSWGAGSMLRERNNEVLRQILEESAKNTGAAKNTDAQLIGDFYASCMDEAAIERDGAKPLDVYFKQIDAMKSTNDLPRVLGRLHREIANAVFGYFVYPDFKNSASNLAYVWQGGLSLPNRDYYTKTDEKSQKLREQFQEHAARMFQLLGDSPDKAKANAAAVMKFETRLALSSKTPVELRDPAGSYNKKTFAELKTATPGFDWATYIGEVGSPKINEVNLAHPDFFRTFDQMLKDVSLEDWKTYLRWQVLTAAAPFLSKSFADENFAFFRQTLSGVKEQQPRWRRCAGWTDAQLGEALGQEFVKRNFSPDAKRRMNELISNLFAAYRERIQKLDWMSDATKTQALAKLGSFQRKIGYPDVLRGYKGLSVDRRSFFGNVVRATEFATVRDFQDIGRPVDKTRWGMTAPTVDAYYNPTYNEIVFPAGILQPPFFDEKADDAVNYGQIGSVIGHEITHGFDDQGSQFDAAGNLKMWWTPEDRKRFEEKADCVVRQFGGYEVDKDLFINGRLTVGENIADLGGVIIAYNAFKKALEGKPRPPKVDGFTPEQRFFIAYAQAWLRKSRPEAIRLLVQSDPHSVSDWRAMGPLSNMPEFAEAFQCKVGDRMVREGRCQVW
jgi:putative endopeptidase